VSYYPSQIEIDEIKKIDPSINVKSIPAYIFDGSIKNERNIEKTKDIMFIGGFTHNPNVDAVLWYAKEIFPLIKEKYSELKTYIIGSNPPEDILKLDSENIIVKGYVTDEQLTEFYKNCRLSIVPLRYGAGIKGKVIEAMYNQVPVVTTSIGAEGLLEAEDCLIIEDSPGKFADAIVNVYNDFNVLSEMSDKGKVLINKYFSDKSVINILSEDFYFRG
jgi:glycosyltransferase involved in cell wall biosynthesis